MINCSTTGKTLQRHRPICPRRYGDVSQLAEVEEENTSFWSKLEAVFARPSFAFTFVAACMLAGLFVAEIRLSKMHAERSALFAKTYLHLIDPLISQSLPSIRENQALPQATKYTPFVVNTPKPNINANRL